MGNIHQTPPRPSEEEWAEWMAEDERDRRKRAAIKATPCPHCGAEAGKKCVTASGNKAGPWHTAHKARLDAAGYGKRRRR